MIKQRNWLSSILVLQVVLALGLYWGDLQSMQSKSSKSLLSFDKQQVTRITISDDENIADLKKADGTWTMSRLDNLPVNPGKLRGLIDKLEALQAGWPIATSDSSHQRFEVADDKFQRRIALFQGDQLAGELFVGTSPGFRKVHARRVDDDAIYAVKLNNYELPADEGEWLDKTLLAASDLNSIKGVDFSLTKNEDKWQLEQTGETPEPINVDEDKVKQLVSSLTSLRVQSLAAELVVAETSKDSFKKLDVDGSSNWQYELFQQDEKYYIRRNDLPHYFEISKAVYERIASQDLLQLTKRAEDDKKIISEDKVEQKG
jgi:hypothetical protein